MRTPVYGVSDDPITLFFLVMRALPAVPLMSRTHVLQPLWHDDLDRVSQVPYSTRCWFGYRMSVCDRQPTQKSKPN